MRQHEWYELLDKDLPKSRPIEFTFCDGYTHSRATVTEILDIRRGPLDTDGMVSINNPLIKDRDGLRFMVNGTEYYIAAAFICAECFLIHHYLSSREGFLAQLPEAFQNLLIEREAMLIGAEPAMSDDEFNAALYRITDEVSALVQSDVVEHPIAEQAFEGGNEAGMQFLRAQFATGRYQTIASIAQYASWRAKYIQRRGGDAAMLYRFKAECLNYLLRQHLGRGDHEQIGVEAHDGQLSIVTGISVEIMSLHTIVHLRGMHLPTDLITKEARRKLQHLYPDVWAKLAH